MTVFYLVTGGGTITGHTSGNVLNAAAVCHFHGLSLGSLSATGAGTFHVTYDVILQY